MEEQTQQPAAQPQPKKKGNTLVVVLLVIFGIIAICGIAGVIGFLKVRDIVRNSPIASEVQDLTKTATDKVTGNSTTISNVCEFLSKETASEILGVTLIKQETGSNSCTYSSDPENYDSFAILNVLVQKFGTGVNTNATTTFELTKKSVYGNEGESVTISGTDEAFWAGKLNQLLVRKGNIVLAVTTTTLKSSDSSKDHAVNVAKAVLPKL